MFNTAETIALVVGLGVPAVGGLIALVKWIQGKGKEEADLSNTLDTFSNELKDLKRKMDELEQAIHNDDVRHAEINQKFEALAATVSDINTDFKEFIKVIMKRED